MREGQTMSPNKGERITCIRSGLDGGPFIFEFELDPGVTGPPMHSHEGHDERISVLAGEFGLQIGNTRRVCRAGESVLLTPADVHTFWNASPTSTVRCRVEHGGRFERAIAQPDLLRLSMYVSRVDPGAVRVHNRGLRMLMSVLARIGSLFRLQVTAA